MSTSSLTPRACTLEAVEQLIDDAYELIPEPRRWEDFLVRLADALGGILPMLFRHDTGSNTGDPAPLSVGYDPAVLSAYCEYLAPMNVWVKGATPLLHPGSIRISHNMCSREVLRRSVFWADFCQPLDIDQAIGATLHREGSLTYNVAVLGHTRRGEFGAEHTELLHTVVPHIQRALKLQVSLAEQAAQRLDIMDTLDRVTTGILLVRSDARVVFMNLAARALAAARDGLIVDSDGIRAHRLSDTAKLRRLIGEAAETSARRALHPGGRLTLRRADGRRPLELVVSPSRHHGAATLFTRAIAIVFVTNPDAALCGIEAIAMQRHGLTPAEARVAALIVDGNPLQQVADCLGVTRNTVKTQLKNVFAKTETHRQAELVKVLLAETPASFPES